MKMSLSITDKYVLASVIPYLSFIEMNNLRRTCQQIKTLLDDTEILGVIRNVFSSKSINNLTNILKCNCFTDILYHYDIMKSLITVIYHDNVERVMFLIQPILKCRSITTSTKYENDCLISTVRHYKHLPSLLVPWILRFCTYTKSVEVFFRICEEIVLDINTITQLKSNHIYLEKYLLGLIEDVLKSCDRGMYYKFLKCLSMCNEDFRTIFQILIGDYRKKPRLLFAHSYAHAKLTGYRKSYICLALGLGYEEIGNITMRIESKIEKTCACVNTVDFTAYLISRGHRKQYILDELIEPQYDTPTYIILYLNNKMTYEQAKDAEMKCQEIKVNGYIQNIVKYFIREYDMNIEYVP